MDYPPNLVTWMRGFTEATCYVCETFADKIWTWDSIPHPPIHWYCHCLLVPYVPGVDEEPTIYSTVDPATLSDEFLGPLFDFLRDLHAKGLPIPPALAAVEELRQAHDARRPKPGTQMTATNITIPISFSSSKDAFTAVLVEVGPTRTLDGSRGRLTFTKQAVEQAHQRGLFANLNCHIDHHDKPSVRNLFGVWHNPVYGNGRIVADLIPFSTDANAPTIQLLNAVGQLPADKRPDIGISIVAYLESDQHGNVTSIQSIESADIVSFPAVPTARFLLAAATAANQGAMSESNTTPVSWPSQPDPSWDKAYRATAAAAIINNSDLPALTRQRLSSSDYATPEDVFAAIDAARAELAALHDDGIIQLPGRPRISVSDPLEEATAQVGYFFGTSDAPTPPSNMRNFADLYVALTGDVHFRGVFDPSRTAFAAATTTTLANASVNAMNKAMVDQMGYMDHWRWYERIVDVQPNDGTLNEMKWITLGGINNLPTVAEGASYTELTVDDVAEDDSFTKYGGYVGITRELIKNSQIQKLQAIPRALATAAIRTRSAAVAALFTANSGVGPTLEQDSKALFHADHKNLDTTALGSTITAWSAARAECFKHTDVHSGKALGVMPRYLLVPAELYDTALSIFGYGEGMPTTYNPMAQDRGFSDPRPIPVVVPDWTDATDWAYIVDPRVYPVIQMSYSQNPGGRSHPTPELYSVVSETSGLLFTNDVMPIKIRDEFAVGVNGPRGIGKRNVAG